MITNFVLYLASAIIGTVDSLLPHFTIPSWLTSASLLPSSVASEIGGMLAAVAPFLPIGPILTVLTTVMAFLPAVAAYVVFQWVYKHVPTIAGFGTGG